MAQRGYVAASINYRLGSAPVLYPVDTPTEFQVVNDARADMQTAVRWFRANAVSLRRTCGQVLLCTRASVRARLCLEG
jgi:carboxylesterase type B